MNASLIASFVTKCVLQILEKQPKKVENGTEEEPQPYDNSYFFILFVMLFYSFLALTVFCGYMRSKKEVGKKDPYEEFMEDKDKEKKWRAAQTVEKFDFEEECIP